MPHRWPAVGAGPGVVHVRHVVDYLPHARPVEGRADHRGGPASPRREHQPDARWPKQPRFSGGFLAQHEDQLLDILRKKLRTCLKLINFPNVKNRTKLHQTYHSRTYLSKKVKWTLCKALRTFELK